MDIREITVIGIFSALAVVLGYLLAPVPNVELFTATIFLAGLLFGKRAGTLVGVIAAGIFGMYNPWGPSPTPLLFAQVFSRAITGFCGGVLAGIDWQYKPRWLRLVVFAAAGFLMTSLYNMAASLSFIIPAGFTIQRLAGEMMAGFLLISLLTLSNVVVFALVVPVLMDKFKYLAKRV